MIKNPVRQGPWSPNMPNNFRGSHFSSKKPAEPADLNLKVIRRRRPSAKQQKTKIFFEQLAPLYPFLSKTQIRSAITLANNNMHQSRLFLDIANKFLKIPPLNLLMMNFQPQRSSFSSEDSTTIDNNFTTVSKQVSSPVQPNPENESSFSTSDNSQSSVYDFNDSEDRSEAIQSWANHKMKTARKKVGVSIIRCNKGYKSFLL